MRYMKLIAKGAVVGIGMIIPGVSGGTLAVLLGIYEELILKISNLRKSFKDSILFLLPFLLGMILAFMAMYFPLKLALEHIPFELCMIFVGLMLVSTPRIGKDAYQTGFHKIDLIFSIAAFGLCFGLCFIPIGTELVLNLQMPWYMYIILLLVGILASVALVVPGISGSMLLLIIGLYKPLLDTISNIVEHPLDSIVILFIFSVGLLIGFFSIAKLMKYLLHRFEHQTKWAILGFVFASIIALFIAFDFKELLTPLHIGIGVGCFLLIGAGYLGIYFYLRARGKRNPVEEQAISMENNKIS